MNTKLILLLLVVADAIFVLFWIDRLSISYDEARLLYGELTFLQLLLSGSLALFGSSDFALRLPMATMHIASLLLFYSLSKHYIKLERNRLWLLVIFMLLPGIMSSSLVVNSAGVLICFTLLYIWLYKNGYKTTSIITLLLFIFIDPYFAFLYFGLIFYALWHKKWRFLVLNIVLFALSLSIFGIDMHGSPKGYFLDVLGIYAAIFSPIIFIFLIYSLYRKLLLRDLDIVWFISSVILVVSLLLSFRQRIEFEYFAPLLIPSLLIVAQIFEHSYRVRLPKFRKGYRVLFLSALAFLVLNSFAVAFNELLYLYVKEPKSNFAYNMHVAKPLASELKQMGIECVQSDAKMQLRLRFYGIGECSDHKLVKYDGSSRRVSVSYVGREIYSAGIISTSNKL
ncbi:MAG: hypothetical protein WCR69_09020 [Sulfuricurvum sp.]|jgi:hypothetical protein